MQNADLESKNSTFTPDKKNENSAELTPPSGFSIENGAARVGAFYAALAGFLLRGAEGLSDRQAERRLRRAAATAARKPARLLPVADR